MPVVSIIVPVYNTEKYLKQCLDSIVCQSFSDFEALLIDDGSMDNSGRICDMYSHIDNRVHVFHKMNEGVSSARNMGLDNVKGDWILFVDSDDILPPNSLEYFYQNINDGIDMALGSYRKFNEDNKNIETVIATKGCVSINQAIDAAIAPNIWDGDWQRYIWNRLFCAKIIKSCQLRFRTDLHYKEDGLFLIQYLSKCSNKIASFPDVVYLYRQIPDSAMGKLQYSFSPKLLSIVNAHGAIYQELYKLKVPSRIKKRELKHMFQSYFWIKDIMKKSKTYTTTNEKALKTLVINNGGLLNYIYYVILRHYLNALLRRVHSSIS